MSHSHSIEPEGASCFHQSPMKTKSPFGPIVSSFKRTQAILFSENLETPSHVSSKKSFFLRKWNTFRKSQSDHGRSPESLHQAQTQGGKLVGGSSEPPFFSNDVEASREMESQEKEIGREFSRDTDSGFRMEKKHQKPEEFKQRKKAADIRILRLSLARSRAQLFKLLFFALSFLCLLAMATSVNVTPELLPLSVHPLSVKRVFASSQHYYFFTSSFSFKYSHFSFPSPSIL